MRVGKPDLFLVVDDEPDAPERLVESLRDQDPGCWPAAMVSRP